MCISLVEGWHLAIIHWNSIKIHQHPVQFITKPAIFECQLIKICYTLIVNVLRLNRRCEIELEACCFQQYNICIKLDQKTYQQIGPLNSTILARMADKAFEFDHVMTLSTSCMYRFIDQINKMVTTLLKKHGAMNHCKYDLRCLANLSISICLLKPSLPSVRWALERCWILCISDYRLDPAHYYTLPGFTFDACLKFTEQELDLFTDSEKFLFIENSIRRGISVVSHRHAKANNPLVHDYDHNLPHSYLTYLDANNPL